MAMPSSQNRVIHLKQLNQKDQKHLVDNLHFSCRLIPQQRHRVLNHTNQVTLLEALVEMCQDVSFPLVMRLILTVKRMDLKL